MDIYSMSAVISRASAALDAGISSAEHEKIICQTYVEQVKQHTCIFLLILCIKTKIKLIQSALIGELKYEFKVRINKSLLEIYWQFNKLLFVFLYYKFIGLLLVQFIDLRLP